MMPQIYANYEKQDLFAKDRWIRRGRLPRPRLHPQYKRNFPIVARSALSARLFRCTLQRGGVETPGLFILSVIKVGVVTIFSCFV